MKLYDVPRETFVRVLDDIKIPIGSKSILKGDIIFFDHLDGMYSFCLDKDKKEIIHLAAFSDVEILTHIELKNLNI